MFYEASRRLVVITRSLLMTQLQVPCVVVVAAATCSLAGVGLNTATLTEMDVFARVVFHGGFTTCGADANFVVVFLLLVLIESAEFVVLGGVVPGLRRRLTMPNAQVMTVPSPALFGAALRRARPTVAQKVAISTTA